MPNNNTQACLYRSTLPVYEGRGRAKLRTPETESRTAALNIVWAGGRETEEELKPKQSRRALQRKGDPAPARNTSAMRQSEIRSSSSFSSSSCFMAGGNQHIGALPPPTMLECGPELFILIFIYTHTHTHNPNSSAY